ncbi:hypothetical protein [Nocardia sp. 348MFTsu5.1]|uniref:hypothetical protein n=1 Tax=Nocardia sp. 348MFTsu5.1 TaxID=1172185 RepID=UPI0003638E3A|nr:hypothetical protein [Nocardia sp. 348MFTsu5.1]
MAKRSTVPANAAEVPCHVVLAEPWSASAIEADETWWSFPDGVADGDLVITVAHARVPAILQVAELWLDDNEGWGLNTVEPYVPIGIAIAALERRLGTRFSTEPRTLPVGVTADVLAAITSEDATPTPWSSLPHRCLDADDSKLVQNDQFWGCNACGAYAASRYRPRLQAHREPRGNDPQFSGALAVCPSCHDILHQPLGPTFDELMFSYRPSCPRCDAKQTFKLLMGMPPGPPPYGTHSGGCAISAPDIPSYICQACNFEW